MDKPVKTSEFSYSYPKNLIATSKAKMSRVLWCGDSSDETAPHETTISNLITRFKPEDVLVINTTKVIKARVTCPSGLEILFIKQLESLSEGDVWEVLCPARRWSKEGEILPCGTQLELVTSGLPQTVKVHRPLDYDYFEKYGDIPLPPYIQQQRNERASRDADSAEYQTAWAEVTGSLAAPTASLHFDSKDLERIRARGAEVVPLCLHVGLGTFLPIHVEDLENHKMHSEFVDIPVESVRTIERVKRGGGRVWALGTTVTRALEAWSQNHLQKTESGFRGDTHLFIKPGYNFKVVDVLLTNFHQPESTLLALVCAFAGKERVLKNYQWAIEKDFRLFSYGDLTVWEK